MATYFESHMHLANESVMSAADLRPPCPKLSLSELLFPAFNTLVPSMYENVLPHLSKVKVSASDVDVVIGAFHSMVGFAFKTQIFDRFLWLKIAKNDFKNINNTDFFYSESSQMDSSDDQEDGHLILPHKLKVVAKTHYVKERLKLMQAAMASQRSQKYHTTTQNMDSNILN